MQVTMFTMCPPPIDEWGERKKIGKIATSLLEEAASNGIAIGVVPWWEWDYRICYHHVVATLQTLSAAGGILIVGPPRFDFEAVEAALRRGVPVVPLKAAQRLFQGGRPRPANGGDAPLLVLDAPEGRRALITRALRGGIPVVCG